MRKQPLILQFGALVLVVIALVIGAQAQSQSSTNQETSSMSTSIPTPASTETVSTQNPIVIIETAKGDITLELYQSDAPKTVKNFVEHAKSGYYNGLTFHRVVPGFVIQGGDPNGNGTGGTSIYGGTFEDELNPDTESYKRGYKKGVLAMANRGPDTNGSQFFIMLEDNDLPKQYTIFGRVLSGQEVVDRIAVGDAMEIVSVKE